ncbi:FmdB family zinc ribbon protein [Sphaerisporangium aureirubrum]|uniref:FmdB family zinc ribbon protein n=1 Tax=Sphaerisporangium aureirubrum TaxID=1544736 RepID=A0ABW1NSV7_9ACTN
MPTYQYACTECGEGLEVVQRFTDDALTTCPQCQGQLRKVFSAVGIVFKGSGFYRTDNRSGSSTAPSTTAPATSTTTSDSTPKKEPASTASSSSSSTTTSSSAA